MIATLHAEAQVTTELSEQSIAVGERVSLIITIEHEEPSDVEMPEPEFPGLRVVDGPAIRPVSILRGNERRRAVEVRFTLEAVSAGRYVLPAVPVSVAGQPYLTAARLVEIGERRNRSQVPFLVRWAGPEGPLYVGEARVYSLELYNVPEYLYPSSISVGTPQNAIVEEVQGLGTIDQYVVDGVTLYAIPVAVFMVTASEPGTMRLPQADVAADLLSAAAEPLSVEVLPLPPAAETSGAVGTFTMEAELSPVSMLRSESTELRVRISGRGNLHFLAFPEPELTGFRIEAETRSGSFVPTTSGYEGHVERTMVLRPSESENYAIRLPSLDVFHPRTRSVRSVGAPLPQPTVLAANEPLGTEGEGSSISMLSLEEIASLERRIWYRDPLAYGWLVPGLLVFVASRFWKRRHPALVVLLVFSSLLLTDAVSDRLPWTDLERGTSRYEEGDVRAAVADYERALRRVSDSPGINHNLAVLYYRLGDIPRAAFSAREAIRLAPLWERARSLLNSIETSAGIERSVPPPHLVHPDALFFALVVLVNALFMGLAFAGSTTRGSTAIIGVLLILLIAGAVTGLAISSLQHDDQLGVVRGDVTLRRIPGSDADGWLPVATGSAVEVVAQNANFLLVRTVLGLEGWVEFGELIWPGSPAFGLIRYRGFVL